MPGNGHIGGGGSAVTHCDVQFDVTEAGATRTHKDSDRSPGVERSKVTVTFPQETNIKVQGNSVTVDLKMGKTVVFEWK